jgi:acyl carrier protein
LPAPKRDGGATGRGPQTATEEKLAAIVAEVLELAYVDVTADLFSMGAHSLLLARIAALVRERLEIDVPLRVVFAALTIEKIAAFVDEETQRLLSALAEVESLSEDEVRALMADEGQPGDDEEP